MEFTFRNPSRSTDPTSALPSARSAVVAAWPYSPDHSSSLADPSASVARYAASDTYAQLRSALDSAGEVLRSAGHRSVVVSDDNAMVDRAIAHRAGIGWYGKNTNILVPGVGSWVVLGTILTDAELPHTVGAGEVVADRCGSCTRCLESCPTGALVEPGVMDASRCLSWLLQKVGSFPREHRAALGLRIYGCDDCQEVCPPNRRAPAVTHLTVAPVRRIPAESAIAGVPGIPARDGGPGEWISLSWLLVAGDEELIERLGSWYIPRREPRWVRRNALVALGNTGLGTNDDVIALLERYLRCDDDMLVEHAAWAARRLGRNDVLDAPDVALRAPVVRERAAGEVAVALAGGPAGGETGSP